VIYFTVKQLPGRKKKKKKRPPLSPTTAYILHAIV